MAIIDCNFYSEVLGMSTSMYVILPQTTRTLVGMDSKSLYDKHPTLFLLHGISDDHTIWLRRTSIERYAASLGIAVIMPAAARSFYTDMKFGYKYWTFISQELPEIARSFFPLSEKRENNFVAGLSMGGYGALKLGFRNPDKFAAVASLSGVVNVQGLVPLAPELEYEVNMIFGDYHTIQGSYNDLFYLAGRLAEYDGPKPLVYQCCGKEDFLYPDNIRFKEHCQKLKIDLTYEEGSGAHEWGYWDKMIQNVLEWLPLQKK